MKTIEKEKETQVPAAADDLFAGWDLAAAKDLKQQAAGEIAAVTAKSDPNRFPLADSGDFIVFDVETGPRPWAEIEQFFKPPEKKPADFDPTTVKVGRLTPSKAAEKVEETRAKHQTLLDAWPAEVENAKAEFLGKAALSPITGEVLAIGYATSAQLTIVDPPESEMLTQFWRNFWWHRDKKRRMIGFNIFGFDLPFMIKRSWLLGVGVPDDLLQNGRYWHRVFVDLMQVWSCAAYGERIKLDLVAAYFGCARKSGSGADFAGLWHDPATREKAVEYLKQDLRVTLEVAEKMGVV